MEASLLHLMEELVESIEQRDAGDPDAPAWEAALRIHHLEEELARRLRSPEPSARVSRGSIRARRDGALVAIG
jgi:hypothetical protein